MVKQQIIKRERILCFLFFSSHQDIYVFHTLLLNINCKPHWRAIELGFIKYDTHATMVKQQIKKRERILLN
jgi:hypothetical protein